jgi:Na+-driven multidrug efflux pump
MINAVHSSQIIAVGRPDISARITIFTVILNISLMLVFIPEMDLSFMGVHIPSFGLGLSFVGAALALMIGNIVGLVIVRYVVYRLTGTSTNPRLALQLLAGGASVLAMYALGLFISIDRFYTLIVFGLVSFAAFLAVLAAIREFTRKDLDFFLELLNVRKMAIYIRDELVRK